MRRIYSVPLLVVAIFFVPIYLVGLGSQDGYRAQETILLSSAAEKISVMKRYLKGQCKVNSSFDLTHSIEADIEMIYVLNKLSKSDNILNVWQLGLISILNRAQNGASENRMLLKRTEFLSSEIESIKAQENSNMN